MNPKTDNAPVKRSAGSNPAPMKKNIGRKPDSDEDDDPIYAGFWIRFGALVADMLIMGVITWPIFHFLNENLQIILGWVVGPIFILAFWITQQATPGKMVFGLRIADAETLEAPSTGQCILRFVGFYISGFVLFLGFIWAAFDERKQSWHDKIAKTVVLRN